MTEMVLKPCPFCGSEALAEVHSDPSPNWTVMCPVEACLTPIAISLESAADVVARWNRRAASPVGEGVREKVAKALGASEGVTWDGRTVWMQSVNDDQCATDRFYRMADIAITILSTGEAK